MKHLSLLISFIGCLSCYGQVQVGIQAGGGIGVGWMIYHNGISADQNAVPLGYDRTYVAMRIPVETEILLRHRQLTMGAGVHRTIMYDQIMIGSSDRRGNRNRYRITPGDEQLIFEGAWLMLSYTLNPIHGVTIRPCFRAGIFRSNTIHPAWEILGRPWLFTPLVDVSWKISPRIEWWFAPQYIHLWKNEGAQSREEEGLHLHSIDIRTGLRFWLL